MVRNKLRAVQHVVAPRNLTFLTRRVTSVSPGPSGDAADTAVALRAVI